MLFLRHFINITLYLCFQGVDLVRGDFQGTSTRIHNESEARANFMKEDQTFRYETVEVNLF